VAGKEVDHMTSSFFAFSVQKEVLMHVEKTSVGFFTLLFLAR